MTVRGQEMTFKSNTCLFKPPDAASLATTNDFNSNKWEKHWLLYLQGGKNRRMMLLSESKDDVVASYVIDFHGLTRPLNEIAHKYFKNQDVQTFLK